MTERVSRLVQRSEDTSSIARLVDSTLKPGCAISLAFSDGVIHVILDQIGDWTITAGVSTSSDRLLKLTRSFEELGFFQATEEDGMIYHLWTSALEENHDRSRAEETLLKVLKCVQVPFVPSYIS